jgi:hypothetical protein
MVGSIKTEIRKLKDTIAQYLTIPRDIVRDEGYPFDRNAELQGVVIYIDYENKTLVVKRSNSDSEK